MTYGQETSRPGTGPAGRARSWTPPQIIAAAVGGVYTLIGILGSFVTGFDNFAGHEGESLFGFHVNPLHNVVHIMIGLAGLALATTVARARLYGWLLAIGYGVVFVYGLFAVSRDNINFLAINGADNVLHLVSALVGLAIALWRPTPAEDASRRP